MTSVDYTDVDPVFGTLADFDALIARAHELGLKVIIDQVLSHTSDQHPFFAKAARTGPTTRPTGMSGPTRSTTARRPATGCRSSAARPGNGTRAASSTTCTTSCVSQPDLNYHNPDVQDWALENMRFWLERGVDGFRFDTVNYFFHDPLFRDDPADFRVKNEPEGNPYGMQYHIFSKNQPENLAWMERIRTLLDEYGAAHPWARWARRTTRSG